MLTSALGHLGANLDGVFGTRSELSKHALLNKQKESLRVASRSHVHQDNCKDGTRIKVSTDANVLARRAAVPQREALIPSTEGSSYVGDGHADMLES